MSSVIHYAIVPCPLGQPNRATPGQPQAAPSGQPQTATPVPVPASSISRGRLLAATTSRGLCQVGLGESDRELVEGLRAEFPFAEVREDPRAALDVARRIVAAALGGDVALDLPLDVRGSRFERRVWAALRAIPRGVTRSYGELATEVGCPRGARAVARACARNPVPVVVPCHRVVPRAGGPGGYRYGAWRKRALLAAEQAGTKPRLVRAS